MHSLCKVASEEALQVAEFSLPKDLFDRRGSNSRNDNDSNTKCSKVSEHKPGARIPKFPPKFSGWSAKWSAKLSIRRTKLIRQSPKLSRHSPKCPSLGLKTSELSSPKCFGKSPTSSSFKLSALSPKSATFSPGAPVKSSFSNDSLYTVHENSFLGTENPWSEKEEEEEVADDCVYESVKLAHGSGYNGNNKDNEDTNKDVVCINDNDDVCMKDNDIVCMTRSDNVEAAPEYFNANTGSADEDDALALFYAQTA